MLFKINSQGGGSKDDDDDSDSDEEDKEKELASTTTQGLVFPVVTPNDNDDEEENNHEVPDSWENDAMLINNYKSNQAVPAVVATFKEPEVPEYHDQFYWK